jgi:hypothetical protein
MIVRGLKSFDVRTYLKLDLTDGENKKKTKIVISNLLTINLFFLIKRKLVFSLE